MQHHRLKTPAPKTWQRPLLAGMVAAVAMLGLGTCPDSQAQGLEPVDVLETLIAPPPPKPLRLRLFSIVTAPLPAAKRAPALVLLLPDDDGPANASPATLAPSVATPTLPAEQRTTAATKPQADLSFADSETPITALPVPQPKPFKLAALVGLAPKEARLAGSVPLPSAATADATAALGGNLDEVAVAGRDGDESYVEVVYVTKQRPLPKDPLQRAARRFVDLVDPSANQIRVKQTRRVARAPSLPVPNNAAPGNAAPGNATPGNAGSNQYAKAAASIASPTAGPSGPEKRPVQVMPLPPADDKCLRDLARMNLVFEPLSAFQTDDGCGMSDGVAISRIGSVQIKPAAKLNCGYAKRLVKWVEGDLSQTVARTTGAQLTTIRHYSAYRCSFRSKGRLSEHALGNALDIGAIETSGDLSLNVKKDWGDHLDWALMEPMEMAPKSQRPSLDAAAASDAMGNAKRRVWYEITKSACRAFKLVLTPHSNTAHANHLHVDMGRWKQCEL